MLAVGGVAVWTSQEGYQTAFYGRMTDTANALSVAIDSEFDTVRASLRTLAASVTLDEPYPNLDAFEREARRTAAAIGSTVGLVNASTLRHIINTTLPPDAYMNVFAPEVYRAAVIERQAIVTPMHIGPLSGRPSVIVATPVERDGIVNYILAARIDPDNLSHILAPHRRGSGFVAIIDSNNIVVARSHDADRFVGQRIPDWLLDEIRGRDQGIVRGINRFGSPVISAFHRMKGTPGWTVVVGEPFSAYQDAVYRPFIALAWGAIAALALAILIAYRISHRVLAPVQALTERAEVVAQGGSASEIVIPKARVAEFERLRRAVMDAERALKLRTAEVVDGEVRLRLAQEAARVGVFESNLQTGETHWSAEMFRIYGLDPRGAAPSMAITGSHLDLIHPDDRERVRSQRTAWASNPSVNEFQIEFRIIRATDKEVRWISSTGEFQRDEHGRALAVRGAQNDITVRHRDRAAIAAGEARLRAVLDTAADAIVVINERGVVETFNRAAEAIFGYDAHDVIGHPLQELVPNDDCLNDFISTPAAQNACEAEGLRSDGRTIALDISLSCWKDPAGQSFFTVIMRDITARKHQEEQQKLLVREVDHRAKNALAVVQALVRMTPTDDPVAFKEAVESRVGALARTHTTLALQGWTATDLRDLLEAELKPFGDAATLSGPDVRVIVQAAQPIAMMIHELATNASKHGAMSVAGGQVNVTWKIANGQFVIRWVETGLTVTKPSRSGFGTRLLTSSARQLGGTVATTWDGYFACEIRLPVDRVIQREMAMG